MRKYAAMFERDCLGRGTGGRRQAAAMVEDPRQRAVERGEKHRLGAEKLVHRGGSRQPPGDLRWWRVEASPANTRGAARMASLFLQRT
jgi:hypothetical protein